MNSKSKSLQPLLTLRIVLAAFFSAIPLISFSAENIRISVSDFHLQSDNSQYKFLGKGFSELISVDISKSKGIDIVHREKKTEILREQELSQTGLIDEKDQIRVGRMLAARYIVTGSIFDIAGQLTVTFKVINTETGKVDFQDKITGKLSNYDYISAQISQKIINSFSLIVPKAVIAKAEAPIEKEAKAAVSFSNAIEAYDKKDMTLAKKELETAKGLDPENEAVAIYLKKLIVNTAKFKTITEEGYPNQNPAYLGIIRYDKLFASTSFINMQESGTTLDSHSDMEVVEQDFRANLGYQFPVGQTLGICVEAILFHYKDELDRPADPDNKYLDSGSSCVGGMTSIGWALNSYFSVGAGVSAYYQNRGQKIPKAPYGTKTETQHKFNADFSGGFLLRNSDETLFFDSMAGFSTRKIILLDPEKYDTGKEVRTPAYNENTITIGFLDKILFFALKEINNIYTDRDYFVGRVIPALEFWVFNWASIRGGIEYSFVKMEDTKKNSFGFTGGLSLRSISLGIDLDANITRRKRPTRVEAAQTIDETILYFAISKSNLFLSRGEN